MLRPCAADTSGGGDETGTGNPGAAGPQAPCWQGRAGLESRASTLRPSGSRSAQSGLGVPRPYSGSQREKGGEKTGTAGDRCRLLDKLGADQAGQIQAAPSGSSGDTHFPLSLYVTQKEPDVIIGNSHIPIKH